MSEIWTIKAALDWTVGFLERKGDESPLISAQWLLAEATGLRRIELYTRFEQPLTLEEREVLRDFVSRRAQGEPLQYITGEVGFRHIAIKVRPGVLIPRPETEVLVSEALALLPAQPKIRSEEANRELSFESIALAGDDIELLQGKPEVANAPALVCDDSSLLAKEESCVLVADLCTGSGCIACSIAQEYAQAKVIATDIDQTAVALAAENVAALLLADRIKVIACNLGDGIDSTLIGCFDLVVSNPPYIPTAILADLPREVSDFEPELALDGGLDGLDLVRPLIAWATRALKSGGALALELHEDCLDLAAGMVRSQGYGDICIIDDLAGRPRVLTARRL